MILKYSLYNKRNDFPIISAYHNAKHFCFLSEYLSNIKFQDKNIVNDEEIVNCIRICTKYNC